MKKTTIVILVLVLCFCLTGCNSSDYKKATELIASKDYASAIELLEKLGDYKDASTLLSNCKEMIASIESFNSAVKALSEKNEKAQAVLSAANEIVISTNKALDESIRPTVETAISEVKAAIKSAPDMPSEVADISKMAEELNAIDYSGVINNLEERVTKLENSIKQYELVNNPSESYVINCLKTVPGIVDISAATEDNDPNGKLNKAGGYSAAVYFSHEGVNQRNVIGDTLIDKGTAAGGQIEVYTTIEDAEKRNNYLATFDGTVLSNGSHTVIGTVVVRTSDELKASQQKALEASIIEALTKIN